MKSMGHSPAINTPQNIRIESRINIGKNNTKCFCFESPRAFWVFYSKPYRVSTMAETISSSGFKTKRDYSSKLEHKQ